MKIRFLFIFFSINLLTFFSVKAQESSPVAKKILAFCEMNKGKKVGKGECWDLAKEALNQAEAVWTSPYEFGTIITKKEALVAGDILQFEKVKIESPDGSWKELPHHTAIVYKVIEKNKFIMAEQNANGKRFVIFSEIDLSHITKGKYTVYRPK